MYFFKKILFILKNKEIMIFAEKLIFLNFLHLNKIIFFIKKFFKI
jgi:hypothetical protein